MTQTYRYGFNYKGLTFGWKDKKLFRLPSEKDSRNYSFKQLSIIDVGNKKGYRVSRDKKTVGQLMELTKEINYIYEVVGKQSKHTPL